VKILQEGLGSLRGAVGTPDQVGDLVRRYEAAGVDQVIFVLQAGKNKHEHICESLELFGSEVMPAFAAEADARDEAKRERLADACAAALARREPARVADSDYVIEPQDEPRPAYAAAAHNGGEEGGGGLAERARTAAESAFVAFVRGRSDAQLDKLIGSGPGLRILFKGMESAFVPSAAGGFSGEILYDLTSDRGARPWTVAIDGEHAVAEPRVSPAPAVTLRARVPIFVRIAAGELDPARALLDGDLTIEGDYTVAGRLGEMFGSAPRW
jgi:putative sterol carrier protein